MKLTSKIKSWFKGLYKKEYGLLYLMLGFLSIILFVYCYFGTQEFFANTFINVKNLAFFKVIYHNVMAFVLFFGVGCIVFFLFAKQKAEFLGLKKGNRKLGLIFIAIGTPICALLGLSTVLDAGMKNTYPLISFFEFNKWYFIVSYFVSYALYYVGWEFLFRGVALNISKEKIGDLGAILLTTVVSALIHTSIGGFGKPMIETFSAIFAGLIFGFIAVKTKSIWYSFYLHALVGFSTDLFIFLLG